MTLNESQIRELLVAAQSRDYKTLAELINNALRLVLNNPTSLMLDALMGNSVMREINSLYMQNFLDIIFSVDLKNHQHQREEEFFLLLSSHAREMLVSFINTKALELDADKIAEIISKSAATTKVTFTPQVRGGQMVYKTSDGKYYPIEFVGEYQTPVWGKEITPNDQP